MPEGPEVKIASDYFNKKIDISKKIVFKIISEYYHNKYQTIFDTLNKTAKINSKTYTIGKNIFLKINQNQNLNIHLGMTGGWKDHQTKHTHFCVYNLAKKNYLYFEDVRKFGKIKIINTEDLKNKHNCEFDILNKKYNMKFHLNFLEKNTNKNRSICKLILDQRKFPGVGNYIKSEALYLSKIHPEEKWGKLNKILRKNLIKNLQFVMTQSYKAGGAELRDFDNPFKKSDFQLNIYGKKITPQSNKVTRITTSDGRTTWYCNETQKLK